MLKKITIENYRSCLKTSFSLHPNLTVLIGPNSSGKTNILQAIMLLNKIASREEHGMHSASITASSRIKAQFLVGKIKSNLNASVNTFTDESNNDVVINSRQRWILNGPDGSYPPLELPMFAAKPHYYEELRFLYYRRHGKTPKRMTIPDNLPNWTIDAISCVSRFCSDLRYYSASQFTDPGSCPVSFEIEEGRGLAPYRVGRHTRFLYQMYVGKEGKDSRGYNQFFDVVGPQGLRLIDGIDFNKVKTSSTDFSVRVGGKIEKRLRDRLLIIPQFRVGRQRLSPNQLSEGTFKTLALLFFMITEASSLLLIEEPEVCIHQGLLSSILELIKNYSRQKQIVVSTHSDFVLDHVCPENVCRVSHEKGKGTTVHSISKLMTSRELTALKKYLETEGNLGDYWREGGLEDR